MDLVDRVAHRLKLRDLRLLDVVVRSKSMAGAAAQLNLTQPAVSKAISELEHMTTNGTDRAPQYADLRERNVDLVFGPIVKPFTDDRLQAEILFAEDLVVAAATHNRWSRRRSVTLADLIDEPWCLPPPDSLVGLRCVEAFRAGGVAVPERTVTAMSMQLQMGLVTTQDFLTMFPSSLVRFGARRFSIKALPIELPVEPRLIGIVTLKNRTISPVAQLFVQAVREVARPLNKRP